MAFINLTQSSFNARSYKDPFNTRILSRHVKQGNSVVIKELGCPTEIESLKKWMANDETFCKPVEGKDTRPEYQARIGGFIGERLATVFWTIFSQRNPMEVREVKLLEPGQKI